VGGNIGGSLLNSLNDIGEDDWVVLELSSFMLESMSDQNWSPHIAVVTNFSDNHLDWHGTDKAYRAAKQGILAHQESGDVAVLGEAVADWPTAPGVNRHVVDSVGDDLPLLIPGRHNQINAQVALWVCKAIGIEDSTLAGALSSFRGLEHRLQLVTEHDGIQYFNDSKCTTPQAAQLAIESFNPGVVHVILGGYDKGADLKPLAVFAANHCRAIYTIGATGITIAGAAGNKAVRCETLDNAMSKIHACVNPGDIVLLSPGCASWDQFDHYQQRGDVFTALVPGA
jgi:UDP-N-acetylmuramoylalanine--D-glutamate ligase